MTHLANDECDSGSISFALSISSKSVNPETIGEVLNLTPSQYSVLGEVKPNGQNRHATHEWLFNICQGNTDSADQLKREAFSLIDMKKIELLALNKLGCSASLVIVCRYTEYHIGVGLDTHDVTLLAGLEMSLDYNTYGS